MASRARLTNKPVAPMVIVLLLLSSLIYFSTATAANIENTEFHFDLNSIHKTAGSGKIIGIRNPDCAGFYPALNSAKISLFKGVTLS